MSNEETRPTETQSASRSFWKGRPGGMLINLGLIVAVVAGVLWLPPISLSRRLVEGDYVSLGEDTWSLADPDGTQFTVLPEGLQGTVKAKLVAVPRSDLLSGTGSEDLIAAAESIPSFLDIRSPLYRVSLRGDPPSAAILTIPIPNDATPYETLDVYSWTGAGWVCLPSQVIGSEDVILVELDEIPQQLDFAVAQTRSLPPVVSAETASPAVPESAAGIIVELNPRSLFLGDGAQIVSTFQVDPAAQDTYAVVPVLSNLNQDGTLRNDLVDNLLVDQALQDAHVNAILETVRSQDLQGIEIDYRAINPGLKDAFSDFIARLANELHQQGKILIVHVELPRQVAFDQWETGAFDWHRLGKSVDAIKIPAMLDPQAYVLEGEMDQLIRWAVSQVSRQQVQFVLSTRSVDRRGSNPTYVSYSQAMLPFTKVTVEGERDAFKPEERVVLNLSAGPQSTGLMYDEGAYTYWFRYRDDRNEEHTVWLENAASIANKLRILARYNLRGVAFQYLLEGGNDERVWQVVREFHTMTIPTIPDEFAVVWTVEDGAGTQVENLTTSLTEPRLVWVAPEAAGEYKVIASISSDGGKTTTVRGEAIVEVQEQAPEPTPTPEPTKEPEPTPTPEPTPSPTPEEAVASVTPEATVTNDVLNLRAGPGTNYNRIGQVRRNDILKILGKNPEGTWIQVVAPDGTQGWVILTYVQLNTSLDSVAVARVPAAPTPSPQQSRPSQPSQPAAPAPRGTGFGYGVQAHAHNDLPKVVNAINDLGFGWLKQQVRWEHTEGSKGDYGWSGLDTIANASNAAGVKVLFSVVAAPSWARGGKSGVGPPDNYQDFYNFMGAMAAHFKGRVQAYEIWNEQNLKREWEGAPLSAADYVRLLSGAYRAIKAADPNAIVVSGAPTPTGISDGNWAIDDRTYLQQMYNAGLRNYCDAVGAHPSGYANPPDVYYQGGDFDPGRGYDDHPSFFFRNTMEDYYRIMAANGDGAKRVWATEFGWPTVDGMGVSPSPGYEFSKDINQQQQADYLVRAYTWARNWGHAGVMFLWNLNFWPTTGPENEMAKYGIVRGDWAPRPAYTALKNMAK